MGVAKGQTDNESSSLIREKIMIFSTHISHLVIQAK